MPANPWPGRSPCDLAILLLYSGASFVPVHLLRQRRSFVKKILGLVGILAVVGAVMTFMRRGQSDDEFLDEELE